MDVSMPTSLRQTTEVLLLVAIGHALAEFTTSTNAHRDVALFQSRHWIVTLSISSISPWLVSSSLIASKTSNNVPSPSKLLWLLYYFEWVHCTSAGLHHLFGHDAFAIVGGINFLLWVLVLVREKATSIDNENKEGRSSDWNHHLVAAVVILYLFLWRRHGNVYILSGAGQVLSFVPFVYLLLVNREMYAADFILFSVLGCLFIAENLSNTTAATEVTAQSIHLFGHFVISWFFHGLNERHFSGSNKVG